MANITDELNNKMQNLSPSFKVRYTLHGLTQDGVRVERQTLIQLGDEVRPWDEVHSRAYSNNSSGRQLLTDDNLPTEQHNAIMAVWGSEPTLPDPKLEEAE